MFGKSGSMQRPHTQNGKLPLKRNWAVNYELCTKNEVFH